jgi:hypothetical protein
MGYNFFVITKRCIADLLIKAFLAWFCVQAGTALAQGPSSLFEDSGLLEIELIGPVSSTIEDRERREERAFVLVLNGVERKVWVRVRGKSRSREEICEFPPLRLRFEAQTGMAEAEKKLKLVTHCQNGDRGDANVMEEYAAYRTFGLLSPVSFRVRPLWISYEDTEGRLDKHAKRRYGFLIEPLEQLALRTGGVPLELEGVSLSMLDPDQAALVYVFQYMIGNTDWSLVTGDGAEHCCHNGALLEIDERIHYVPYDFDLTGLVNPSYAKPDPSLRLRNVRSRRYRGFCTDYDTLLSAIRSTAAHEEEIYEIIRTTPGLSARDRNSDIKYLSRFFEKARDEKKLQSRFDDRCKSP